MSNPKKAAEGRLFLLSGCCIACGGLARRHVKYEHVVENDVDAFKKDTRPAPGLRQGHNRERKNRTWQPRKSGERKRTTGSRDACLFYTPTVQTVPTMPVRALSLILLAYTDNISFIQKHYCDYCDVYLTHDSASGEFSPSFESNETLNKQFAIYLVRKAHNSGRNHLANVRDYYACEFTST